MTIHYLYIAIICKARAETHIRAREGVTRVHVSETAARTVIRTTAQKNQLACGIRPGVVTPVR